MTLEQEKMLTNLTHSDAEYQKLLKKCIVTETEYQRILALLNPEDRQKLEHYISLCEELEYRRTCLAMNIKMDSLG